MPTKHHTFHIQQSAYNFNMIQPMLHPKRQSTQHQLTLILLFFPFLVLNIFTMKGGKGSVKVIAVFH